MIQTTGRPGCAMDVLRSALQLRQVSALGVYCREPSAAMEVIVRSHGAVLLRGLVEPKQWEAFLAGACERPSGGLRAPDRSLGRAPPAGPEPRLRVHGKVGNET